jgi:hypothetical protein
MHVPVDALQIEPAGQVAASEDVLLQVMRSQRSVSRLQTVSAGQSAILQPPATTYVTAATPATPAAKAPLPTGEIGTKPLAGREPGQPKSPKERPMVRIHRPMRMTKPG